MNFELLKKLCQIPGVSSDESRIKAFILEKIQAKIPQIQNKIEIISHFQDNLMVIIGDPKIAVYAHMDTIGYTLGYNELLIKIGGIPQKSNVLLQNLFLEQNHQGQIGHRLSYAPFFEQEKDFISSPYLDNRLGCFLLLELLGKIQNVAFVFSTSEETGKGAAGFLAGFLYEKYTISKALILDVTWDTPFIKIQADPVLSLRDGSLPRQVFLEQIQKLLNQKNFSHQKEVESSGGSDGSYIQAAFLPIDWCFLGIPIENIHHPREKVFVPTIKKTLEIYRYLLQGDLF